MFRKFVRDYTTNDGRCGQVSIANKYKKLYIGFRMAYSPLILTHSDRQGQGHTHFDGENL